MSEDTKKVIRFINSRIAACTVESRKEVMEIIEKGDVTLEDVVTEYIRLCRGA